MWGFAKKHTNSMLDVIRCDEPSYLIWKWHPAGAPRGTAGRENAIRFGSSLRVKDGEVAVFVYRQPDGVVQDYIEGPYDHILETKNLPVISNIIGLAYGGGTPFQAEVYFINLARVVQVRFAVPYFNVYDPRFEDFGVPVAARGTISFHIGDYRAFIKLHRLVNFNLDDFQKQIRDTVARYTKDVIANIPAAYDIPVVQLETKISFIADKVQAEVGARLEDVFGVSVSAIDIGVIEIDKMSDDYRKLMEVTKDISAKKAQAEMDDHIERLRIGREEEQYLRHKESQSANLAAFRTEKQAEVGAAGAAAIGQMGANGGGSIDIGGSSFNPTAMMAGMALGGAVGQNVAGTMNKIFSEGGQAEMSVIPPIPSARYFAAIDGEAKGPFDISALKRMSAEGSISGETLIWKEGTENWVRADAIGEIGAKHMDIPPIPEVK